MTTTTNNTNDEFEFDNDEFIFDSMIEKGYSKEEAQRILDNLYNYGSIFSPFEDDSFRAKLNEPIVLDEDDLKFAREYEEMITVKSSEQSAI